MKAVCSGRSLLGSCRMAKAVGVLKGMDDQDHIQGLEKGGKTCS